MQADPRHIFFPSAPPYGASSAAVPPFKGEPECCWCDEICRLAVSIAHPPEICLDLYKKMSRKFAGEKSQDIQDPETESERG